MYMYTLSLKASFLLVNFKPSSALLVTSYCALRRKDSLCACARVLREQGGTGGGGWGRPQGDIHMVAVVAGCRNGLVGTGWANSSCIGCTNVVRKCS